MAINPEIRDQAYRFFVEEAPELLQAIEAGLLTLRQERNPATIHAIMRSAHSLKGGAASVGLDAIKTIAHRLETIFKALYSDRLEIDAQVENQLLQAYDCLRIPLTEQITQGYFDVEQSLAIADPILNQLEIQFQEAIVETENFIPGSADLGIDMAASIFEIDVAQGLAHLEQVLEQPQNYEVAGELRAQAEVFLGFAELLNLPGFAEIAQTVIQAIDQIPNQAVVLTQLALNDFQAGRDAVLAGDMVGGSPSIALRALLNSGDPIAAQPKGDDLLTLESLVSLESGSNLEFGTRSGMDFVAEDESTLISASELEPESSAELNLGFDHEFSLESELQFVDLSEAEIEAIVQQELLQSEAFDLQAEDSEAQFETQETVSESRLELESVFTNISVTLGDELNYQFTEASVDCLNESPHDLEKPIADESNIQIDRELAQFDQALANEQLEFYQLEVEQLEVEQSEVGQSEVGQSEAVQLEIAPVAHSSDSPLNSSSLEDLEGERERIDFLQNVQAGETDRAANAADPVTIKMPTRAPSAAYPTTSNLTVRVDVDRLERLNNLLGEMTINRNGLALQTDQTRIALRELRNRFERMQSTIDQIRTLSDQMLLTPDYSIGETAARRSASAAGQRRSSLSGNSVAANLMPLNSTFKEFDSLEMDRYTTLYASTQALLEELVQIEESVEDIVLFNRQSQQTLEQHRKMLSQMQEDLMWARMLPLGDVLNRFPRMLRDLSNTYDKPIDLFLNGTDLLIDKAVLEKLYDPLLHLLRNSFDHGIESAELRGDRGKPPSGRIEIQANARGRQVVIEVRDDGQGLDFERIRQRAAELGWITPTEAAAATEAQLCELIFAPGFSTAAQVSELSGRGMGLDVVREQLQSLKGSVTVRSFPAQGTTFILTLPLTLTITNLLICLVNSRPIAFRSDGIREILIPQPHQLSTAGTGRLLQWQDRQVPIYAMADLLTYRCLVPELPPSRVLAAVPAPSNWESPVLILKRDQQFVALQIDRLVTEQEFVVKPFGSAIAPADYAYGCTVLGDGMLVPVIDGQAFLEELLTPSSPHPLTVQPRQGVSIPASPPIRQTQTKTILVVDDALTSRRMLALSLERAGYRVLQARDGQEALEQLQQSHTIALVVCDIEMPNMNGFEFLTHRRQDANLAAIPTVMLTSRSNDKHRWLAMQLGATAYFTKPYLEQEFLQAIEGMVEVGR